MQAFRNLFLYEKSTPKIWIYQEDCYFIEYFVDRPNLLLADLWLRRRIPRTAEIRLYGETTR